MSNTKLYIPKKLKIGYQNRSDCYNGKLSYIIYYDDKNVLRKETSWKSWRDKKIPEDNFDNTPLSGFVLNKDVKRYNWSHFSSKRTLIRVFDPRGMEFEITTDNLLFILQNTDCIKRELVGEFSYAWLGPELILLPKDTEEYRLSSDFTDLQAKKFSAKNLVAGRSYKTKQAEDVVYVGRHMWYNADTYKKNNRLGKKYHIFTGDDGKTFELKSSADFLAAENSDEVVSNFADIVDKFNNNTHSSKIVKFELKPVVVNLEFKEKELNHYNHLKRSDYFMQEGNEIRPVTVHPITDHKYNHALQKTEYTLNGYYYQHYYSFNTETQSFSEMDRYYTQVYADRVQKGNSYHYGTAKGFTKEQIANLPLCDLYVTLENGKRIKVKDFNDL